MSSEVKTPNPFQRLYRGLTTIDSWKAPDLVHDVPRGDPARLARSASVALTSASTSRVVTRGRSRSPTSIATMTHAVEGAGLTLPTVEELGGTPTRHRGPQQSLGAKH